MSDAMIGDGAYTPDLIHPVIGYRGFRINDGELHSPWWKHIWESAKASAKCIPAPSFGFMVNPSRVLQEPHESPAHDCTCGFYAFYHVPKPQELGSFTQAVIGVVVLAGVIEAHEKGMRAQHIQICALGLPSIRETVSTEKLRESIQEVADCLGVITVEEEGLEGIAAEFGLPMPIEFRSLPEKEEKID